MSDTDAVIAYVDRKLRQPGTSVRRATVVDDSPFTVQFADGTQVVSVPHSPRYYPIVGDIVRVEVDGPAFYVTERLNAGWVDDAAIRGGAVLRTTGGAATLGNGTVVSQYKVDDGMVDWYGHYSPGSTTVWPGGNLLLAPPVNYETTSFVSIGSQAGGAVRAYNGTYHPGLVEYGAGGTQTIGMLDAAVANTFWSNTQPFAWAAGNILSWNLRYPAA